MSGPVDILIEERAWKREIPDLADAANAAASAALTEAGFDPAECELSLLACDDARISALNARFRGIERPTNVLSWPALEAADALPGQSPRLPRLPETPGPCHLGDVALALQTAMREANQRGVRLKSHAIHLILHGSLHLCGYDHETAADAALMEGTETRLLRGLGIADPYVIVEADADATASNR